METEFGKRLRACRLEADLTMAVLAEQLEITVPYLSDVERGRRAPFGRGRILKIAEILGIDPSPLLAAAAISRGAFELDAQSVGQTAKRVGAALARGWPSLTEKQLEQISRILEVEEEQP